MREITKEHIDFVVEAKDMFERDPGLTTYRDEGEMLIALRAGFGREDILVYELGNCIGNFVEQVESEQTALLTGKYLRK